MADVFGKLSKQSLRHLDNLYPQLGGMEIYRISAVDLNQFFDKLVAIGDQLQIAQGARRGNVRACGGGEAGIQVRRRVILTALAFRMPLGSVSIPGGQKKELGS